MIRLKHRILQWDCTLEHLYPLTTIDEELDIEPPPSILRQHLAQKQDANNLPQSLVQSQTHNYMDGRFPLFRYDAALIPKSEDMVPRSILQPTKLVMPAPLSPARFPIFECTDTRIEPSSSLTRHFPA